MSVRRGVGGMFVAVVLLAPSAAFGDPPDGAPVGGPCRYVGPHDESLGTRHGVLGGAVTADGTAVTLTCSIRLDWSGGPVVTATSATTPQGAVVEPRPVAFAAPPTADVYVCATATVDGTHWYWAGRQWRPGTYSGCRRVLDTAEDYLWCLLVWGVECVTGSSDWYCYGWAWAEHRDAPGVVDIGYDGDVHLLGEHVVDCAPYEDPPQK